MDNIKCANCSQLNPPRATQCFICGAMLTSRMCPRCGKGVREKSTFCTSCGAKLSGSASAAPVPPPAPQYSPPPAVEYHTADRNSELRDRTLLLKDQFGAMVTQGNYKEILKKKDNPITRTFIDFIAWGITRFWSFTAFIAAITILGVLLGGWGVVLAIALSYVYSIHRKEIMEKIKEIKGQAMDPYKETSASRKKNYVYYIEETCTGCAICLEVCPVRAIVPVQGKFAINSDACNLCGRCLAECPSRAIIRY